ncbi:MAG: DUF445 domain-containing protein [Gammaproteobacteria bacterium]|nr:DUF445 domain-containing protein [Gammaproteobacteria bacterium]
MNKGLFTNLISFAIVVASFVSPWASAILFSVGIFALSGAVTNWLAVHMLFERVPLLYGSGVIPNRFEQFKGAIKKLVMEQFFGAENVKRFIVEEEDALKSWFKPSKLIDSLDYDSLFNKLVKAIMESNFGSMLGMFGGESALEGLRPKFIDKIKEGLSEMADGDRFRSLLVEAVDAEQISSDMVSKIEALVDKRLEELTPELVKQIVQDMIREHLGWLVVWGGVFGGLIGLIVSAYQANLLN